MSPVPAFAVSIAYGGSGARSLDAQASLASCGLFENQIVCMIDATYNRVRQAVASDLQARGINAHVGGALQITDPRQIHDVIEVTDAACLLPANLTVN